ncbi:thiamine pyrophosphate-binding protein [Lentibacter algarum]|uniref:thiamine pyrophosphate-binding protein n=1 Tax=Lentibacter algarum TaxID=576131 RepID=UPI001C077D30|nr:thiamine pyrophosphate-binding protein [Lentibacter algarum]MBU2980188.1 thiamine pyrophosphate-binding protein [Lentibacter algarum]
MAGKKGAELITEFLVDQEIPYVFGICGHGNVGMLDALYDAQDDIQLISPRHEQTAGHMADAYFRIKHEPVATLTSCGPGSANMVMPLALAMTDSSAMFSITANVPTQQFNRGPFQEINRHGQADFPNVLKPVVKRSFQPTRVEMLPLALRQGMATMLDGRPGPVQLDVPFNLFQEEAEVTLEHGDPVKLGRRRSGASPSDITTVADMLLAAETPVLFIGHGVTLSEASEELTELARKMSIPVISSPNGMGCLDMADPLSLGFIGRNGAYTANQAGRFSDLVIAVGARFDDRSSSSWKPGYSWNFPKTKLVHVDVDQEEIGRNYAADVGILADARTFLRQLLVELDSRPTPDAAKAASWNARLAGWREEWNTFTKPNFDLHTTPIRPERIVADCQKVLPDDAILTFDAGIHHNWFMQFWNARKPASMLNSWGFSGMGFGPSAALGAKLAAPHRPVISVCGDGGFTMVPHVLCTAVEYNIPVVWVVWNNFAWGAIRDIQYGAFNGREIGTAFYQGENSKPYNPDFAGWARASGVTATTVTRSQDFAGALDTAIKANVPYLIDVHVDADVRPPATGTWHLPPIPFKEPVFGAPFMAD